MSANIYTAPQRPPKTRIPVASPSPLRRSYSVRLKGDKTAPDIASAPLYPQETNRYRQSLCNPTKPASRAPNHYAPPELRRGKSFMERGERGNGNEFGVGLSNGVSKGPCRADDTTAEHRSRNGGLKGSDSPDSPNNRTRSLVSWIMFQKMYTVIIYRSAGGVVVFIAAAMYLIR